MRTDPGSGTVMETLWFFVFQEVETDEECGYFMGNMICGSRIIRCRRWGAHDVLIRVKACGVCGTDVHIYEGDPGAAEVTPPTILGHEFSGVVEAVGSGVRNCRPRRPGLRGSQLLLRRL